MVSCRDRNANGCLQLNVEDWSLLIHARWKRDVMEQGVGESPTAHESFVKRGRTEELTGQVAECRIARSHEAERIDRRCEPEAPGSKECRETVLEKDLQEVLGRVGFVAQIFDFAQPMETVRFQTDAFMETGCRRTLAEPLRGFGDHLSRNLLMVKQNPPLAEQGRQPGRIVEILGDGFVLAVANVYQAVGDANHFLSISRSLDQDDEIDIAVGGHGAPRPGPHENDTDQIAAAFRAYVFDCDGEGIVVAGRGYCRGHFRRFRNVEQLSLQFFG